MLTVNRCPLSVVRCPYTKKRGAFISDCSSLLKTAATYSPTCAGPSARSGLTSLFGMGRGGTPTL